MPSRYLKTIQVPINYILMALVNKSIKAKQLLYSEYTFKKLFVKDISIKVYNVIKYT